MSRDEVEAMFTLSDLKKTRVYRDALQYLFLEISLYAGW
jgi:predicted transposase YdaD